MTAKKHDASPGSFPIHLFLLRIHLLCGAPTLDCKALLRQLCARRSTN